MTTLAATEDMLKEGCILFLKPPEDLNDKMLRNFEIRH